MAVVLAFDDVKAKRIKNDDAGGGSGEAGKSFVTRFFGSRDTPDLPQAALAQREPGRVNRAHYHTRDQFQVGVDGKGTLGRHDLTHCVHFSRAYTPYGPLVSDATTGSSFLVLRAHFDPGGQRLPQ